MRFITFSSLAIALWVPSSAALNIIVNNDDGFGSANIREFYRLLKAAGHNAWIVAPVDNESGQGGRSVFTTSPKLNVPSEFNLIPAGAPSFGTDPMDDHIWYYNGTPAACTFFALDYVVPNYWNGTKVDLLVAGPNFGQNLGPFLYTLSGTMGATYAAVGRGVPGIAFSAFAGSQRSYLNVTHTLTAGGYPADQATINAQLSVSLVNQIAKNTHGNSSVLPQGYGISVNYPPLTTPYNSSCISPPFIQTRLTGGAESDKAVFNASSGLFTYADITPPDGVGINTCINGDCSLPGETIVAASTGCASSVSVFTVDYDAPNTGTTRKVMKSLKPLVKSYGNQKEKREEKRMKQSRYLGK